MIPKHACPTCGRRFIFGAVKHGLPKHAVPDGTSICETVDIPAVLVSELEAKA